MHTVQSRLSVPEKASLSEAALLIMFLTRATVCDQMLESYTLPTPLPSHGQDFEGLNK